MNAKSNINEMDPKNAIAKIMNYIETTKQYVNCTQLFETIQQVRLLELYIDNLKKTTDEIKDRFEQVSTINNGQLKVITNQYISIIKLLTPQNNSEVNDNIVVNDDSEVNDNIVVNNDSEVNDNIAVNDDSEVNASELNNKKN